MGTFNLIRRAAAMFAAVVCFGVAIPSPTHAQDTTYVDNGVEYGLYLYPSLPVDPPADVVAGSSPISAGGALGGEPGLDKFTLRTPPKTDEDQKADDKKTCHEASPHPVILSNGNKVYPEKDISTSGESPIGLSRNYDHAWSRVTSFGPKWPSTFDYALQFRYSNATTCTYTPGSSNTCATTNITAINAQRPNGDQVSYFWNSVRKLWVLSINVDSITNVTQNGSQWVLTTDDNDVETYSLTGAVLSVLDRYGVGSTYNYSGAYLSSVTHSSGRQIQLNWNNNRVQSVTDPAGNVYNYAYNPQGYLSSVTRPTGEVVSYLYEDSSGPDRLTGVVYNGQRYSRYSYNADGTAAQSGLDGGIDTLTFAYTPDTTGFKYTAVTNAQGATTTNTYTAFGGGQYTLTNVSRTGVTGCPNASTSWTYDSNANITSVTDAVGNVAYSRYASNGLLLATKTGSGTDEVTLAYTWDTAHNRITTVRRYPAGDPYYSTGSGNAVEETDYTYVPDGNPGAGRIASLTRINLSGGTPNQARQWTYAYVIGANNLISKVTVTTPQPGPSNQVTSAYDSAGNLTSVADGYGHTTSYSQYNGLGQPASSLDQNNFTTIYRYDGRGRLTLKQTLTDISGWRTYQYSYSALDKLTKVVLDYGETRNYRYDAQGRLTGMDDAAGDSIVYGYDNMSNLTSVWKQLNGTTFFNRFMDYDQAGNLIAERGNNGQKVTYTYDAADRPITRTDALGNQFKYAYNAYNRVTSTTDPLGHTAYQAYDGMGRTLSVTDYRGLQTTYTYDGLGNLVATNSPDAGNTSFTYSPREIPQLFCCPMETPRIAATIAWVALTIDMAEDGAGVSITTAAETVLAVSARRGVMTPQRWWARRTINTRQPEWSPAKRLTSRASRRPCLGATTTPTACHP